MYCGADHRQVTFLLSRLETILTETTFTPEKARQIRGHLWYIGNKFQV